MVFNFRLACKAVGNFVHLVYDISGTKVSKVTLP